MGMRQQGFDADADLPLIAITSPNLPLATSEPRLRFALSARDPGCLLDRLNMFVNDVALYGIDGLSLRDRHTSSFDTEVELDLCNGINKIQASVLNEKGLESLKETFEIVHNGDPIQENLFVVAIGVSTYADDRHNLTYAAKDAKDLVAFFEGRRGSYGQVRKLCLVDRQATKENRLYRKQV
jgi:hypothetical protein